MLDTLRGKYRLSERSDAEIVSVRITHPCVRPADPGQVSTMSSVDHEGDDPAVLHAFLLGLYEDPQNVEQHVAEVCKRPTNEEQCIKYGHGVAAEYKAVVGDFEDFKMHEMFTPTYITCMERTCDCAPPEQRALWDYRQLSAPGKNIAGHFCKELKAHIDLWILAGKYDAEASAFAHDFALDLLQDCWASPDILDVAEKVFNYTGGDMSTPLAGKIAKGLFCRLSQYAPSVEFTSFLERQPQFQRYIDDSCAGGPRPRLRGDTRYCSRVACRRNVTPSLEYACLCRHYGEELLLPAKTPRDVFGTGGRTTGDKTKT